MENTADADTMIHYCAVHKVVSYLLCIPPTFRSVSEAIFFPLLANKMECTVCIFFLSVLCVCLPVWYMWIGWSVGVGSFVTCCRHLLGYDIEGTIEPSSALSPMFRWLESVAHTSWAFLQSCRQSFSVTHASSQCAVECLKGNPRWRSSDHGS